MRQRRPRQLPMRFDREVDLPAVVMPEDTTHAMVDALADLLLAAALDDVRDEEGDDAREDQR